MAAAVEVEVAVRLVRGVVEIKRCRMKIKGKFASYGPLGGGVEGRT